MDVENIIKIGYLILTAINIILVIVSLFTWIKKRKSATSEEEKNQVDEVMRANLSVAMANIKSNLSQLNLKFTTKAIKQAFNETLKKEDKKDVSSKENNQQV